jgi:hypothetical protein
MKSVSKISKTGKIDIHGTHERIHVHVIRTIVTNGKDIYKFIFQHIQVIENPNSGKKSRKFTYHPLGETGVSKNLPMTDAFAKDVLEWFEKVDEGLALYEHDIYQTSNDLYIEIKNSLPITKTKRH